MSCLVLLASVLGVGPGEIAAAEVRVALVGTDKTEILTNALTLAEAKLSQVPGVRLLERQNIDRVLAEQKLNLSGLIATEQVLTLSKLLAVDLFAVVEVNADKKELSGLVIFEAGTGVRLWDAALPSGDLDQSVTAIVDALGTARTKRRAGPSKRTVCLLTVRNTDLPRELDALCDSVGLLLERQLVASPDLALLERRRLEQVNKERDLPLDSPLRPLLASVVTIELEVGASPDRKGLKATVLLSEGQGKSLGKVTATVATRDAATLSQALARKLTHALNTKSVSVGGLRLQEAKRFLREAAFCWDHKEWHQALCAAESAYALEPEYAVTRRALAQSLMNYAHGLIRPGGGFTNQPAVDPKKLELSLALARRGSDLLLEIATSPPPAAHNQPGNVHHESALLQDRMGDALLSIYVSNLEAIRSGVPSAARESMEVVRTNYRRLLELRRDQGSVLVQDQASFDRFTEHVCKALNDFLESPARSSAEWIAALEQLRPWAKWARTYRDIRDPQRSPISRAVLVYRVKRNPKLSAAALARVQQLWAELQEHPNLVIAVEARLAGHLHGLSYGAYSLVEQRRQVHDFRLFVQARLEGQAQASGALRGSLYSLGVEGIVFYWGSPRSETAEELKALCEFMFAHKEIEPTCLTEAARYLLYQTYRPENDRSAHDLLRRGLDLLEGGTGRFLVAPGTPNKSTHPFRIKCCQFLADIYQRDASIAAGLTPPWKKVTTLIDVYLNRKGLVWLQQPLIHDGKVYTAAIALEEVDGPLKVRVVRLTPGQGTPWESRPIRVSFHKSMFYSFDFLGSMVMENTARTKPWPLEAWRAPGPSELRVSLTLGTAACIHQNCYYLGTRAQGIFAFPLDGGLPQQITVKDGLPSNVVQSLTCLDGCLYAALGELRKESYLVAWDLQSRKCKVLTSSRRKEKQSPFDDCGPVETFTLLADPVRGRVLFSVLSQAFWVRPTNGLWAFHPRTQTFTRLIPLLDRDQDLFARNSCIEGDRLVMNGYQGSFVYNLARKDARLIYNSRVPPVAIDPGRSIGREMATIPDRRDWGFQDPDLKPPFLVMDGWIWWASPFCRWTLDGKKVELLPPLRPTSLKTV